MYSVIKWCDNRLMEQRTEHTEHPSDRRTHQHERNPCEGQ